MLLIDKRISQAPQVGLSRALTFMRWRWPAVIMVFLVLLPIVVIVASWFSAQVVVWQHLIATDLGRLLKNTLVLTVGVGVLVTCLGVSLAWLTALCEFPGRRWLDWALMLPLAIPTYVLAFVALGIMSYSGPVLSLWRAYLGSDIWYPDIRHPLGVILVMSCVLYPYVYMLARSAFLHQGRSLLESARLLGLSPLASFWKIALPMARPAIAAGVALALMETLADFGAVTVFNYDTFTTAIYKAWFGFFNLDVAAQLASLLLLFVFIGLLFEHKTRSRGTWHQTGLRKNRRYQLRGWQAIAASGFCLTIWVLAFVVPVIQLIVWVFDTGFADFDKRFLSLVGRTFLLGVTAALVVALMALWLAYGQRELGREASPALVKFASLGYALPGSVLAVGIMAAFTFIDRPIRWLLDLPQQPILVGTLAALILAYLIRFFSVGLGPIQSSLGRIKPHFQEVAQTLGKNRWQVVVHIYLPMLMPGLLTAILLVLVDTMKEMPATLLMRPFGWDTLAVRIYEMTSEGEWQRAALPALTLVLVSILPVVVMIRQTRR